MKSMRVILPLIVLALLAALLYKGMQYDPRALPSARTGKPAPMFVLPTLAGASFRADALHGKPWVLNVFASWCTACVADHAELLKLAARQDVPLVGLAYKDNPAETDAWLRKLGNPYRDVALDIDGRVAIDYGVYGVPETYVIDADGIVVYRHVGPIDDRFFEQHVVPLLNMKTAEAK
jgi:cytochrome c biogenesis protein CcmG, thiol:disulfide interchange protein DsbE